MKHAFFLLIVLSTSLAAADPPVSMQLAEYVGRDVGQMESSDKSAFVSLFRIVTKKEEALSDGDWRFAPQTLYHFKKPELRFFVEISPGYEIPGFCGLRIHVFDRDWKFVRTDEFSTGYRQRIADVHKEHAKEMGTDVLVLKTVSNGPFEVTQSGKRIGTPFFAGKHQLQYYAVANDSLMLIRREDEKGELVINNYSKWSVPEIGMNHPKGTTDQLHTILQSGSDSLRLALLAWVTGRHLDSDSKRMRGASREPIESSRMYENLIRSPGFVRLTADLRRSDNVWIRQYAAQIESGEP